MTSAAVLGFAIILQLVAMLLALRLIKTTGHGQAWIAIAGAMALMAAWPGLTLVRVVSGDLPPPPDLAAEVVTLAVSALMVAGLAAVRPVSAARRPAESAQRDSEAEAERTDARLADAIESMPAGFWLFDAEGRLDMCNARARGSLPDGDQVYRRGATFESIVAARARSGVLAEAHGREDEWRAERMEQFRNPSSQPILRHFADGRWFQVTQLRTAEGGLVMFRTDITELKQHESELAKQSGWLRAILDNISQGVTLFDRDLRLVAWNDQWLELADFPAAFGRTGMPLRDMVAFNVARGLYGPGHRERLIEDKLAMFLSREPKRIERDYPNGRSTEMRIDPTPDGGLVVAHAEITESKRSEATLRQAKERAELANRVKTEFLATMSHELRTPLNVVIAYAQLAIDNLGEGAAGDRVREFLAAIQENGNHILQIVNDSLDVAKIEAGKLDLTEDMIEVAQIVESCQRLIKERAREAEIRVAVEIQDDLPWLRADARRVKQVLINLLANAVKFTEPGGEVAVRARLEAETGNLILEVADTGIGMDLDDIARAFQPFVQLDTGRSRMRQGTGLGLPLVKSLIELHGGRVEVSTEPGVGTTVAAHFPHDRVASG